MDKNFRALELLDCWDRGLRNWTFFDKTYLKQLDITYLVGRLGVQAMNCPTLMFVQWNQPMKMGKFVLSKRLSLHNFIAFQEISLKNFFDRFFSENAISKKKNIFQDPLFTRLKGTKIPF